MKKIIINTIIIGLLSVLAFNNQLSANNGQKSTISNQQSANTAVVTINDMNGKVVYAENFTMDNQNDKNIKLNPDHKLSKGIYVVTVVVDGKKMTQKLIVE